MRRRTEDSELTVRSKVDRAICDMAALVVADPDWQIVAVDERDVVPVIAVRSPERELGQRGGRDTLRYKRVNLYLGTDTTTASGLTPPVWGSHSRPPLQPPSRHEFGPGFTAKLQLRRACR